MIITFGTPVLNDDISRHFFIFLKFSFSGLLGGKSAKNCLKWKLTTSVRAISQEQYSIWSWILVHMCKMMISPANFFIFWKGWIFGFFKVHQWMARKFWGVPQLLRFIKKPPRPNLQDFQYEIWSSTEFSAFLQISCRNFRLKPSQRP